MTYGTIAVLAGDIEESVADRDAESLVTSARQLRALQDRVDDLGHRLDGHLTEQWTDRERAVQFGLLMSDATRPVEIEAVQADEDWSRLVGGAAGRPFTVSMARHRLRLVMTNMALVQQPARALADDIEQRDEEARQGIASCAHPLYGYEYDAAGCPVDYCTICDTDDV